MQGPDAGASSAMTETAMFIAPPHSSGLPAGLVFPDMDEAELAREEIRYRDRAFLLTKAWPDYLARILPRHCPANNDCGMALSRAAAR
jgi:hypothetical protein